MIIARGVQRICGEQTCTVNSCTSVFVSAKEKQQQQRRRQRRRRRRQPALLHLLHHEQHVPFRQAQQKTSTQCWMD